MTNFLKEGSAAKVAEIFNRMLYFTVHVAGNREPGRLNQTSHSFSVLDTNKLGMFKLMQQTLTTPLVIRILGFLFSQMPYDLKHKGFNF